MLGVVRPPAGPSSLCLPQHLGSQSQGCDASSSTFCCSGFPGSTGRARTRRKHKLHWEEIWSLPLVLGLSLNSLGTKGSDTIGQILMRVLRQLKSSVGNRKPGRKGLTGDGQVSGPYYSPGLAGLPEAPVQGTQTEAQSMCRQADGLHGRWQSWKAQDGPESGSLSL